MDEPGAWLFRVGDIGPNGNVEPPQAAAQDNGEPTQTVCELKTSLLNSTYVVLLIKRLLNYVLFKSALFKP